MEILHLAGARMAGAEQRGWVDWGEGLACQELSRQRIGLASQFRYTLQQWWARPGEHTSAGLCIGAAGAAGAAAAAELQLEATHWRHRRRTGAGGVTGYTVAAPVEDWRRRAAAPVGDRSRRTSREPPAGVMDRRRSGHSSDSESRSLRTAGLGQPAGSRHSPAQTGVRRGTSDGHG